MLTGFEITFSTAMTAASAGNASNYQVDWISTKKVKKQKKPVQVFHPLPITVMYDAATDTVDLILKGTQAFSQGEGSR